MNDIEIVVSFEELMLIAGSLIECALESIDLAEEIKAKPNLTVQDAIDASELANEARKQIALVKKFEFDESYSKVVNEVVETAEVRLARL